MDSQSQNPGPDRLLSLAEVAAILGLAAKTLRNALWARSKGLPCGTPIPPFGRLGKRLVVRESDLWAWLDSAIEPIEGD